MLYSLFYCSTKSSLENLRSVQFFILLPPEISISGLEKSSLMKAMSMMMETKAMAAGGAGARAQRLRGDKGQEGARATTVVAVVAAARQLRWRQRGGGGGNAVTVFQPFQTTYSILEYAVISTL